MGSHGTRYRLLNLINRDTDVSEIERLLKEGESPNQGPSCCPSPLHRAVRFNRPDIALVLLRAGCQVTTSKRALQVYSPVITTAASLNMNEVVLNMCTKPECNIFAVDGQVQTIVHIAVVRRNCELVQGLLSCCRDDFHKFLTARDGLGLTPLHLAAAAGDVRMLKLLLQLDEGDESEQPPKPPPDHTGGEVSVQDLQDHVVFNGRQETDSDRTPASCKTGASAVDAGSERSSQDVHQKGPENLVNLPVMGSKETMLHLAAKGHHLQMVQLLLSCGARVNTRDMMNNTPLHRLVSCGNADHRAVAIARLLLNAGVDWSVKGSFEQRPMKSSQLHSCPMVQNSQVLHRHREVTAGMMAAIRNRVAYLKLLAEYGEQFKAVDAMNMTTLMHALSHGSAEAARFLLLNHEEPDVLHTWTDAVGNTALHLVSFCHSKAGDLTELMLDRGYGAALWSDSVTDSPAISVTAFHWVSRQQSFTPVTRAIVNQQLEVLRKLVRHRPSCLLERYTQVTHSPLHVTLCCIHDQRCVSFVDFLLAHGCDGNDVVCGRTPYEYAIRGSGRGRDDTIVSATYLKKKLGVVFREDRGWTGQSDNQGVWPLRDICMERLRKVVREAKGRYFENMSSLPLPQSVIRGLLFES